MKSTRLWGVLLGLALLILVGVAILVWGFRSPTQDERENRRELDAVLTAITMKNTRLLDESARRAKARHDAGHFTDDQFRNLEAFIDKARAGDWPGAEKDAYAFRKKHPFVMEGR